MNREDQLDALLDRWEQHQRDGRPVRPEDLCTDAPDLLDDLRERIEALAHVEALLLPPPSEQTPAVGEQTLPKDHNPLQDPALAPPGYELHAELGRGGMGVVYKARQKSLKRLVALKMLLTGAQASPDERRRFRHEARAIARLQHPNIVQVFEIGEHEGCPFVALEYVDGGSLAEHLRGRSLPPVEAAQLVRTLAETVQAAHDAGIVHRDLKPANVLLAVVSGRWSVVSPDRQPSDASAALTTDHRPLTTVPKITDFGLAKRLDEDFSRTYHGTLMGTPAYMSPEQTRGIPGPASPTIDVYALGIILYECLTGQVPFRAATLTDLLDQVETAEPVPPIRLNARLPRDLDTICLKCIQKAPTLRYQSARELAEDLARFLDGRPILARPTSRLSHAVRWANRNRALAALYAVSLLALVTFVGLGSWFSASLGAARIEQEALHDRAVAAERVVDTERFFTLLTRARDKITRKRPGWTRDVVPDLTRVAQMPQAAAHLVELRSEAAVCFGAVDARLTQTLSTTLPVHSLAWHPSKRQVAVGTRGTTGLAPSAVHVFDLDSQNSRRSFFLPGKLLINKEGKPAPDIVTSLAFSPDGRWLAAGLRSGRLHLWDTREAAPKSRVSQAHAASIERVQFSADGQSIYAVAARTVKRLTREPLAEAAAWTGGMVTPTFAVHPHDGWLAVSDHGQTQRLHPQTLQPVGSPLSTHGTRYVLGADGRTMLVANGRSLVAWDVEGNRLLQTLRAPDGEFAHDQGITDLVLSSDGTLLLSSSDTTHHVRLWDLLSGQLVADLPIGAGGVKLAFAPGGRAFAVTSDNRTLYYEVDGRQEQTVVARRPGVVTGFVLGDKALACVTEGPNPEYGELDVWHSPAAATTMRPAARVEFAPLSLSRSYPLAFVGDETVIGAMELGASSLRLANVQTGTPLAEVPGIRAGRALVRAPDGRLWGVVGDEVRAWDRGGKLSANWKNAHGIAFQGVSGLRGIDCGTQWVVVAGQDGSVRVLPAKTGELPLESVRNLTRGQLSSVALSPDQALALAGSEDGRLFVVRIPSADLVGELPRQADRIVAVDWAGNDLVACGCYDGTVTLYHRNGDELTRLVVLSHGRSVKGLQFYPDGLRLAVLLSGERGVRVWHLDRLKERLGRMQLAVGLDGVFELESRRPR